MSLKKQSVLLPSHIVPSHYDIFLQPDLDNFVFEGEETIEVEFKSEDKKITLHSAEIEVFSASANSGKKTIEAKKISYNKKAETVTLFFPTNIPKGKAKINIKFAGILNDKMRGFYRSRYEHNGKTYHMAVTQFESTDARRAFPCFDEPALKATFDVSLRIPTDRTVISNTLEEEVLEHEAGYKVVRFERSPKMSSYLLAFVIGHFEYVEKTTPEGVKVRVYVTPGKKKQALFALDTAAKLMSFYDDYFGIAYPLPTMDLIAIPDFANGAMENWGAVTYRETALLVDDEHSSLYNKQWVAMIIAHELAHQWFGNLVTMKWWTHLWLNEGFASFIEYLAIDKLFPKWKIWTQFVFTEQARALSLDGLENTHAIEIPVHHPGEISEIFDTVSYSKGASVIRMIESYVGEKDFQKGLSLYLKTHKFGNAETEDLWSALEKVSKKPVGKIMKNWTSKPGYPLVSVEKKGDVLEVKQARFFSNGKKKSSDKWLIPLAFATDKLQKQILMKKDLQKVTGFSKATWIKANAEDTSFVRVKYSAKDLANLKKPIESKKIKEEGRFAIIRDAFALVEAGKLPLHEALELLTAYKKETSYIVWAEIVVHLLELKSLFFGKTIHQKLDLYIQSLLGEIVTHLGWAKKPGESHEQTLLRSTVTYALGASGEKSIIKKAQDLFKVHVSKGSLDSDIRSIVFALTAENGGEKEYTQLENIYRTSPMEEEKDRALRAMCSFKDKKLLLKTLKLAFSSDVRAQDAFKATYVMAGNPNGISVVWDYMNQNWNQMEERFGGGHLFARFISPFSRFTTLNQAEELEEFFKKNKSEGIDRTVAQTLEKIRSNAQLIERELPSLTSFLAD